MTRLDLDQLSAGRDGFRLGPLDLQARGGEIIAVIGPNGAGKTTLLKTLAGLIRPLSGAMAIEADALCPAAYLPPPGAVVAGFSALHLTALGRAARRGWSPGLAPADIEAARSALTRLNVIDLADRPFDHLSSGQQQLVLVARLMVQEATVCLLDEPLAMLDPAHAVAVETAVRALAGEGRLVIASTHGLAFAARANRVIALGPDGPVILPPGEALSPARMALLFGVGVSVCPCCGQPVIA
jgi:ABC-type cobalamin/Fe3+-siderophores transport system ATPase subunit